MKTNIQKMALGERTKVLAMEIGETIENGMVRIHRYRPTFVVTDLTNAGKRGKVCDVISLDDLDGIAAASDLASKLDKVTTFAAAKALLEEFVEEQADKANFRTPTIHTRTLRGVDVAPAGFKKLSVKTADGYLTSDNEGFSVRNTEDQHNLPTCIARGDKTSIKQFYRWASDNIKKLPSMKMNEITDEMSKQGIRYHQYCAMD